MVENNWESAEKQPEKRGTESNVKHRRKYERFGETIRYLTVEELQKLFDHVTDYRHKLMFRLIYELGCRVGEFVRIRLSHMDFSRGAVYFPAENTKTGHFRTSHVPQGLTNEVLSMLKREGRAAKRDGHIPHPDTFLFHPPGNPRIHYSENRLRQIFQHYVRAAGLEHQYGTDCLGRRLFRLTIHSLRHSHIMQYIHIHKLPLPIVQKQVGHKTLKATSVYLRPSDEAVAQAYGEVRSTFSPGELGNTSKGYTE
jgi:integrase